MKLRYLLAAVLAATVVAVAGLWVAVRAATEETEVRYDRESKYYRIQVIDYLREGRRCLHFSKSTGIQSSMILSDPTRLDLRYTKSMIAAFALHPEAKDVLLVGLGGASLPKFIQKEFPQIRLDIVELDADIVKVCQTWFGFKGTPNTRVIVMDGRIYLKQSEKKYDLILLDAYSSDHIPFHMTTTEFVDLVKADLKPGGAVATNLWEGSINRFYLSELATYRKAFPQLYTFRSGGSGNIIVFATLDDKEVSKDEWTKRAEKISAGKDWGFAPPAEIVGKEWASATSLKIDEKPLTDDMAPVDTLRHESPKYFDKP
jgi:spermidine synthase